jgi:hypothetical protein
MMQIKCVLEYFCSFVQYKKSWRAGAVAQAVGCLPSKCKTPSSNPSNAKHKETKNQKQNFKPKNKAWNKAYKLFGIKL